MSSCEWFMNSKSLNKNYICLYNFWNSGKIYCTSFNYCNCSLLVKMLSPLLVSHHFYVEGYIQCFIFIYFLASGLAHQRQKTFIHLISEHFSKSSFPILHPQLFIRFHFFLFQNKSLALAVLHFSLSFPHDFLSIFFSFWFFEKGNLNFDLRGNELWKIPIERVVQYIWVDYLTSFFLDNFIFNF